jgi:hypothetical protein
MRTRIAMPVILAAVLPLLSGCLTLGRQPQLAEPSIEPDVLRPGDSAVITVQVHDRYDIVERVSARVREDDRIVIPLADDGLYPDEEAGDGIWSVTVDVPFYAPSGGYTLVIGAYDDTGELVLVRNESGTEPLIQTVALRIEQGASELPVE